MVAYRKLINYNQNNETGNPGHVVPDMFKAFEAYYSDMSMLGL